MLTSGLVSSIIIGYYVIDLLRLRWTKNSLMSRWAIISTRSFIISKKIRMVNVKPINIIYIGEAAKSKIRLYKQEVHHNPLLMIDPDKNDIRP